MKLSECKIGTIVIVKDGSGGYTDIGHIIGLTYNVNPRFIDYYAYEESRDHTIPLIKFPDGSERGVNHCHLEIYNESKHR